MCTAASYKTRNSYFGRTLDYYFSYGEEVTVTPRHFPLSFRHRTTIENHYAMIGMAHLADGYPLYYDATNEMGLAIAGLNFVGNAIYHEPVSGKENIAQFELIPWILSGCASVREAKAQLQEVNLCGTPFSAELPTAQLHWILADREESIVVESVAEGLRIYPNPVGVLTNNPPFPIQLFGLNNYMGLSRKMPENRFGADLPLKSYSQGMGALGLPGDLSSPSRFVRAAFVKENSLSGETEEESVGQFFHILGAVEQQRGCCEVENGEYEITIYTSCCNLDTGIYYYTTYGNRQISAVAMHRENLDGSALVSYPLVNGEQIRWQN